MTTRSNIEVYAGIFPGTGHNISQLAKFATKYTNGYNVKTILFTQHLKHQKNSELEKITYGLEPYFSNNTDLNVFHLGNNIQSVPVFETLINSIARKNVVILHDLFLGTIFETKFATKSPKTKATAYMSILGTSDFLLLKLSEINSTQLEVNIKARIAIKILNYLIPIGTELVLSTNSCYENELKSYKEQDKLNCLDLPIGFHTYIIENNNEKKYDIIISGHDSKSKKIEYVISEIKKILLEKELKILILGGISTRFKEVDPEFSKPTQIVFKESSTNEEWDELHQQSKIGIRLGVGMQGEKSGSVRDYLVYGMQTISDEETQYLKDFPNFKFLDDKSSLTEIIKICLSAENSQNATLQTYNNVDKYYEQVYLLTNKNDSESKNTNLNIFSNSELYKLARTPPKLNFKVTKMLSSKFSKIYVFKSNSEVWELDLKGANLKTLDLIDISIKKNIDLFEETIAKRFVRTSLQPFLEACHNDKNSIALFESLENIFWVLGEKQTLQIIEEMHASGYPFLFKEDNDSIINSFTNFDVISELLLQIAPWQNFVFEDQKYVSKANYIFVSETLYINFEDKIEEKTLIQRKPHQDKKNLKRRNYITKDEIIKCVEMKDHYGLRQIHFEYLNWLKLSTFDDFKEKLSYPPRIQTNTWGTILYRQALAGTVLTELETEQDKNLLAEKVFKAACVYSKNKLYPNDLRPWNIIVDQERIRFIDLNNDIHCDEDADGIPQILALYLSLAYVLDPSMSIPGKISEIRKVLNEESAIIEKNLNELLKNCWENLSNYDFLLDMNLITPDVIRRLIRSGNEPENP